MAVALLDRMQDDAAAQRVLPIQKHVVAIPAFHAAGHSPDELPQHAALDTRTQTLPFDIRHYPDVLAACRPANLPAGALYPLGIWSSDLIEYGHEDAAGVWAWVQRKAASAGKSERARRALFWRESRPLGILERFIGKNVVTDNGALTMLKVVGSAAPSGIPYNHLELSADAKIAQVSTAMGTTGVTSIPVVGNGTAFTNGMSITLGYGTANAEVLTVGSGSTGTSIVCSATTKTHAVNDYVVQNPTTSDNPASVTSAYDSGALGAGAFTYSGAGAGARQVQVVFNFPANASAPGGGYTDAWLSNAATIAAGTTAAHLTRSPLLVNGTTGANVTYTDTM